MRLHDRHGYSQKRRSLLKALAAGAAAFAAPTLPAAGRRAAPQAAAPAPVRKDGMLYRRLGRTELLISEVSLGGSPMPEERLLYQLVERGVNYFDTSDTYENGNGERKVGRLFKAFGRDRIHIHSRFHLRGSWTEASIIASVEGSLKRLGTDHAEILGIHGVEDPAHVTDERVLGAFDKLKAQGKFRFRGLTCHVNQHKVIPAAVASGLYDMVQIGYNVFDILETEKNVRTYSDYLGESGIRRLIDLCHGKDVGVTAMKVLKVGGRRQDLPPAAKGGPSIFPAMIAWALENPKLAAVVTEILDEEQMAEDLGAVGKRLSQAERGLLAAHVAAHAKTACHQCGLCESACPSGVETARVARSLAYLESYGKAGRARAEFSALAGSVSACRDCGACERACPYGLAVRERTRRAAALLV